MSKINRFGAPLRHLAAALAVLILCMPEVSFAFLSAPICPLGLRKPLSSSVPIRTRHSVTRHARIVACAAPSQNNEIRNVMIMASNSKGRINLFKAEGAKPYAAHLAQICKTADTEGRFLNEDELQRLATEPDIASGIRRLLSRFEVELPTVIAQIDKDMNEIEPDRQSQLAPEEWQRWGQLMQYILLSARGDEYENDDLQGIVAAVENLIDKEAAVLYCRACKTHDLELEMVRAGIRRMTAPYDVGACWAEVKGRKVVYALDALVRDAWNAAGTAAAVPGLRL